jgi:predicted metal-binding membrane protein
MPCTTAGSAGYLLVWGAAGFVAYGVFRLGQNLFGGDLSWRTGERWFAGGVLAIAAIYELTPLKDVCLGMPQPGGVSAGELARRVPSGGADLGAVGGRIRRRHDD